MIKKSILYLLILLISAGAVIPAKASHSASKTVAADDFYTSTSQLLQKHVKQGQVNYSSLRQDKALLQKLVQQISSYDLSKASASEKKAFYINAYNLLVLQQVLENYPLKSVMDVKGFFDERKFSVAGQQLNLNQLEKQKLLEPYQDARIHFAVVCAAKSCPPLLNEAYTPEKVEQQLQAQSERTLNSQFVKVQPKGKKVLLSEIFKWYKDDFLREAPDMISYINRYRSQAIPKSYSLGYYTYNWNLNDINTK